MKQNQMMESYYGLKGFPKSLLFLMGIFFACLISCNKDDLNETLLEESRNLEISSKAASTKSLKEEFVFTAVALIDYCHGENIRFTGTIENRVTETIDANGVVHYIRSFQTKGMTGTGLTFGTNYDVIGGAEMFAVKDAVLNPNGTLNLPGSLAESDIVIHQGTLVFRNRADGSKVVARHIIRKVPGSSTIINEWKCGG